MKLNKVLLISVTILAFISIVFVEDACSWSGATHRILSENAALSSVLNKENYLVTHLGFKDGLGEKLTWEKKTQRAIEWLQEGSHLEDAGGLQEYRVGKARSFNHFHDPLEDWTNAGLDDYVYVLGVQRHVTGESSLVWAQDGKGQESYPEKDWSWKIARDLYYVALVAVAEDDRQAYFAMLFRGLGHQMHLIQDMGVPSHARNDAHPEQSFYTYDEYGELYFEPWAARNGALISTLAQIPRDPTVSLDEEINNYVPITQLTDANKYNEPNPSPSASTAIGLAEYTNANYFSDDTIFASEIYSIGHRHYFPYPNKSSTDMQDYINGEKIPETIIAEDGVVDTGVWISKTGDGEQFPYLVKSTYATRIIYTLFGEGSLFYSTFHRDEICHEDYAFELVSRAVGYSAALLDYFFRGKIEMVEAEDGSGYEIKNDSEEDMEGTFELYYDDINNERKQIANGDFPLTTTIPANGKSNTVTFTPPDDAKEPDEYILVFQGRLGNEDGAVVGAVANLAPSSFVLLTQTLFKMDVPGFGSNNATCWAGGEVLGMISGGTCTAKNKMLRIKNAGGGVLWINGVAITDNEWNYENWYLQTGWPVTWEIQYFIGQTPVLTVEQHDIASYSVNPYIIREEYYSNSSFAGDREYEWWTPVKIICAGGRHIRETWWKYKRFDLQVSKNQFRVQLSGPSDFFTDNLSSGSKTIPTPLVTNLAVFPEYSEAIYGEWYFFKWGDFAWFDGCSLASYPQVLLYKQGFSMSRLIVGSRQIYTEIFEYSYASDAWEIGLGSGLCPEDSELKPSLCDFEYPYHQPNNNGDPTRISELECTFSITGSSLEALFSERGYPMIERHFDLKVEGVMLELL